MERRFIAELIDLKDDSLAGVKLSVRRLQENRIVCTSVFGLGGRRLVVVDFLGRRRRLAAGPFNLARLTGASLIPLFAFTDSEGALRVVLESPLHVSPQRADESFERTMGEYLRLAETYITNWPEQWYEWDVRDEDVACPSPARSGDAHD